MKTNCFKTEEYIKSKVLSYIHIDVEIEQVYNEKEDIVDYDNDLFEYLDCIFNGKSGLSKFIDEEEFFMRIRRIVWIS